MKKKLMFLVILVCMLTFVGIYMIFFVMHEDNKIINDEKNYADMAISTTNNIIFIKMPNSINFDMMPTLDKIGVNNEAIVFSIKAVNSESNYVIKLLDNNSTISNKNVRYSLEKNGLLQGIFTLSDDGIIDTGKIKSKEEISYTLHLWLDINSDVKMGKLSKKIQITDEEFILDNSKANHPELINGMIPVYYDYDKMSFCKSSIENTYQHEWYNYEKGLWANAVTVDVDKRLDYINSDVGTEIQMDDVNAMFVWIPRFNYEVINDNFKINFVTKDIPSFEAFSFNNKELSGFWVTKFEAGIQDNSECATTSMTVKCNNSDNMLIFKPNMLMMNKITMANLFYNIRKMELKNNIYGFIGNGIKLNNDGTISKDNNNFDIHMLKNSEWQAISLLASKNIVGNRSNKTGMSYYEGKEYTYDIANYGPMASTTNNVSGVYDMVGGRREYVMLNNASGNIFSKKSNSGFTSSVKKYYYDDGLNDLDKQLSIKYEDYYLINNEPATRGGYRGMQNNIFTMYGISDYINKISNETNSRAVISVIEGDNNG